MRRRSPNALARDQPPPGGAIAALGRAIAPHSRTEKGLGAQGRLPNGKTAEYAEDNELFNALSPALKRHLLDRYENAKASGFLPLRTMKRYEIWLSSLA